MDNRRGQNNRFRHDRKQKKEKKMSPNSRRCPHCGCEMRCRGAYDSMGGISWKCKNKTCGRRVREWRVAVAPEPIVPHYRR